MATKREVVDADLRGHVREMYGELLKGAFTYLGANL